MRAILLAIVAVGSVQCLENGLARTPPMGWISWQRYRCNLNCKDTPDECISEGLYKRMADRMAEDGWREAGYEYVNIDDCWSLKERDANGRLVADPERFPSGIPALVKYMHDRGLKLGIYGDVGVTTCAGYPGSYNYVEKDAQIYAEWGVDMLKHDGCFLDPALVGEEYKKMQVALNKTGKTILYSCEWPLYEWQAKIKTDFAAVQQACNMFRNYHDIDDSFESLTDIISFYSDNQDDFVPFAKPGAFFDPDMLLGGNYGITLEHSRLQMALWAIFAAPLMMSNDLGNLREEERRILMNPYVIAVNQDEKGAMGRRVKKDGTIEVFTRCVEPYVNSDCSIAIAVTNRLQTGGGPATYSLSTKDAGLTAPQGYYVTDLFENDRFVGILRPGDNLTVTVNPGGVRFLKARVVEAPKDNMKFLSMYFSRAHKRDSSDMTILLH